MSELKSLQEKFAPNNGCFGCGNANELGLQLKSYVDGEQLVAKFNAQPHHEAFEGMLNGGIIGSLLDCHCNWAAAYHLLIRDGLESLPCTVTAEYKITMKLPTPTAGPIHLTANVVEASERKVVVEGTLGTSDTVTALCRGIFVSVKPGHPAYNRW
jgi:acyl-coenzyme A thioesterase PaaI-like protein